MRVVIQRAAKASVAVDNSVTGEIRKGLLVLAGFETEDTKEDLLWTAKKLVNLRIFDNEEGKMDLSVKQINGEVLLVSQFTLYGNVQKGNRPSYVRSEKAEIASQQYDNFRQIIEKEIGKKVEEGVFQANMKVELINDGPVTIIIDSKQREL
jgi:D-tyrosyl-tRNA(Tyr) deacylase